MSKYYVDKFLFTVDRDPELLRRYKEELPKFRGDMGAIDRPQAQ